MNFAFFTKCLNLISKEMLNLSWEQIRSELEMVSALSSKFTCASLF